jgi:peptide/nickel transport system substrate-binding protein
MINRRNLLRSAAATIAGLAASTARAQAPAIVKPGGTLTVAIFADPISFDPHLTGSIQGRTATQAIHDTLLSVDENGRLAPRLAESWEFSDEGKIFTVKLRSGIKFHDGTAFDAAAVKYNIDRINDPKTASIRKGEIRAMDRIEVVDSNTVRFILKYPFTAFAFPLTDVAGAIGSPTAMEKWGPDYGLHPVGTGPFKLAEYQKDTRTVLEKNPEFWMPGQPYLDRVIMRPITTDSTRLTELRAGGVQMAEALPLQDIVRLRQTQAVIVSEKVGFRWEYFGFNLRNEYPGRSKRFRQAFQWAIDREALHKIAYFGTGSIGFDGILPGSPFFDGSYKPYTRDVEKAKRLIGESGISASISIKGPLQPDPVKQRAAQIFQANAAEIGVRVDIEQVDSAGYSTLLFGGQLPMDLQGWWGYRPDPDQYLDILLSSTGSYAKAHGYQNPDMDKLVTAQREAATEAERKAIFRQISALMNEDAVYVPWHYSSDFKGLQPTVKGFVHAANGITAFETIFLAN